MGNSGPILLEHLQRVGVESRAGTGPLRLPVQWVCGPNQHFGGFAGMIVSAGPAVGKEVVVVASGRGSRIGVRYSRCTGYRMSPRLGREGLF